VAHPDWAPFPDKPSPELTVITDNQGVKWVDDRWYRYPAPETNSVFTLQRYTNSQIAWWINTNLIIGDRTAEAILRQGLIRTGAKLMAGATNAALSNRFRTYTNDQWKALDWISDERDRMDRKKGSGGGDLMDDEEDDDWAQQPYISSIRGSVSGTNCPGNEPHHVGNGYGLGQYRATPGDFRCFDSLNNELNWENWTNNCRLVSEYSYPEFKFPDICAFDFMYNADWPALLVHYDGTWAFNASTFSTNFWWRMGQGSGTNYGQGWTGYKLRVRCWGVWISGSGSLHVDADVLETTGMMHPEEIPPLPPHGPPTMMPYEKPKNVPNLNPLDRDAHAWRASILGPPDQTYTVLSASSPNATTWTTVGSFTTDSVYGYGQLNITNTNSSAFFQTTLTNVIQ